MNAWRYLYAGTLALALIIGVGLWNPLQQTGAQTGAKVPRFVVDPSWPRPLPNRWVTGEVAGTCIDSKDHIFTVNRRNLLDLQKTLGLTPAPPVIEFDGEGNVVNAWGDPAIMPNGVHGCFVDHEDNVWIAGNGDGIVQKYSHDGKTLLLQIGTKGVCDSPTGACGVPDSNSSRDRLNQPADVAVDPTNGDIYIADGYGTVNPAAAPLVPEQHRWRDPAYPDNLKRQVLIRSEWYGDHYDTVFPQYIDTISA